MDERQANAIADALGGESWQSGGGIYVVAIRKPGGRLVVISDERVAEYASEEDFDAARPDTTVDLIDDPTEYWVVQDEEGTVFFAHDSLGWPDEYEAEHEARALQSRTGLHCFARQQRLEDAIEVQHDRTAF